MADSLTEGLKHAAPHWSLAGDKQLLDVLQGLHQKIIEKCQETNRNLEKMVTALDEASIHLQNVNNKFTSLSNSQFIESRVYDDDFEDQKEPEKPKEPNESKEETEWERISRGLKVLESMHESVTILCDSDSESGTDDDEITRVVLKPKDLYADRPLPYIIGSKAWKAKWHAGLLPDESDSDSASVKETAKKEEYSDSEPEPISESPRRYATPHNRPSPTISSSSDIESEEERPSNVPPPSQSDVAAELARRLGGGAAKLHDIDEDLPPNPTVRKVYKPHQPTPGNVFLDEPPPIESDQSENEDDIFAEINKKQPYRQNIKADNSVADDLFGRPIFDEVPPLNPPANQKQLLFEDESEPELFASERPAQESKKVQDIKKPIGATSLFGSNANAESIGAAISKRNQRQSSTSGEDTEQEPTQTKNKPIETPNTNTEKEREVKTQREKERDIFEDLFAKSERINKEKNKIKENRQEKEQFKKPEKKLDLFSDNIFDDIDDIFTTNVKIISKDDKKQQKSIFDDDDDLFSEISETVKPKQDVNKVEPVSKKDIFVDEDEIFNDKPPEIIHKPRDNVINKSLKGTKSLFDDSDDDLFSDVNKSNKNDTLSVNAATSELVSNIKSESTKTENAEKGLFSDDDDLFRTASIPPLKERKPIEDSPKMLAKEMKEPEISSQAAEVKNVKEEKGLFSDDDDIFKNEIKSIPSTNERKITEDSSKTSKENKSDTETSKQLSKVIVSPDLFDEEDDGLFLFQSTQRATKDKQHNEIFTQNQKDLLEKVKQEKSSPDINTKDVNCEFGKEDVQNDIFSENEDNNKDFKKEIVVKSTEVSNLDLTVTETKISSVKPKISEKPVSRDVTLVPNNDTESLVSHDVIPAETTVIDNKITVPEINATAFPNVANEIQVSSKPDIAHKPIVAKKPTQNEEKAQEKDSDDVNKVINADKTPLTNEEKSVIPPKPDLFDDIFNDQPPVFEKPKEPKKSKNVNALFEDDSDDESLFFKKNDVIPDERPEGFTSADDKLFGLFMDEPPAIDVDFAQKSSKSDRLPKANEIRIEKTQSLSQNDESTYEKNTAGLKSAEIGESDYDSFLFGNKVTKNVTYGLDINTNTEDLFSNIKGDIFKNPSGDDGDDDLFKTIKVDNNIPKEEEERLSNKDENVNTDNTDGVPTETKKVGKLKPMNLNINVNTLLPGASPKKVVKASDNIDGQASSRSNDESNTGNAEIKNTETVPTLVKSVSFEGNPDSSVLDNKLSKERAKIQVKRRPSTRRARREAVKKSGIDFGEDSTDNSSSIDDQSKINKDTSYRENISAKDETVDFEDSSTSDKDIMIPSIAQDTIKNVAPLNDSITSEDNNPQGVDSETNDALEKQTKSIFDSNEDVGKFEDVIKDIKVDKTLEQEHVHKPSTESTNNVKDVKSKVVYVLNDEDIFNNKTDLKPEASESISKLVDDKPESLFSDTEDLFKRNIKNEGITTLGQVYESKPKTQKLDFLSDSDDDLFKTTKTTKVKPVEKKPALGTEVEVKNVTLKSKTKPSPFDVGDDDFFKGKVEGKSKKMPSLFGSDSDEELFGGVKKEKEIQHKKEEEIPQKKQEVKKEEIKKEVNKRSLFDDNDDDDLFGVKAKKKEVPKPQAAKMKKEEMMSKHPEPVFTDPLSLLGSDED